MISTTEKLLTFRIEQQNFAIPLDVIEVVINIVEINDLPHSSNYVLGVMNYHGDVLPVIDLRYLFQLKSREIELSDKLIIIELGEEKICLWIDKIGDITSLKPNMIKKKDSFFMELNYIDSIFILEKDMVFLQNVDNLFTKEEMQKLHELISKHKQKNNAEKLELLPEKVIKKKNTAKTKKKIVSTTKKRKSKLSQKDTNPKLVKDNNPKKKKTDK